MSVYPKALGVHLLPATGEWVYDTVPYLAAQYNFFNGTVGGGQQVNTYAGQFPTTDYTLSMNQLQAQHPECQTVSVVCAWFFDSINAGSVNIYPSTIYLKGATWFESYNGHGLGFTNEPTHWMCSGLTEQSFPGIIPLPMTGANSADIALFLSGQLADPSADLGSYIYGGTPSDSSIVNCILDLKSRGFKVIFYPFLLATCSGYPWRGRITFGPDMSSAATAAVNAFFGTAAPSQFTRAGNTVDYSGNLFDWTYRRMILHYANLCVIAGGVNLFSIGSELRGLETIRGPAWTPAGTTDNNGKAVWDYPFVAGLRQLGADVRSVFDGAGLTKNLSTLQNLITYSADWSNWMGYQHPGANGQWPHLDALYADPNFDLVSFDNYLPLTDWTTAGNGGLDALKWTSPAPSGTWPPSPSTMSGLGLAGVPTIYSTPYIKANIEGGQYFNWFYNSGAAGGHAPYGLDPLGSGLMVTLPAGDREAQARNPYYANQQSLAPKQLRWWWNNTHEAVYEDGDGHGWAPHGPATQWVAQSKPLIFLEYGFSSADKSTNQPNVFFDAKSTESATAFWSIWDNYGSGFLPRRDDTLSAVALEAVYQYWNTDTPSNNQISGSGMPMLETSLCCVWNWDARPFPTFPIDSAAWGDTGNWAAGDWSNGLRTALVPPAPTPSPLPPSFATFPVLSTLGWSSHIRPRFSTEIAPHVSGRETRAARRAWPLYEIELTYDVLRSAAGYAELQALAAFFEAMSGQATPFWAAPPGLSSAVGANLGTGDGATTTFPLQCAIAGAEMPVYGASAVSAVYLNGSAQASGWAVSAGYAPAITFSTAPGAGVAVTADFGILWLCRFANDVQDFEEFMAMLFRLQTLRLQTVRP